jgi:hypothetical protein
LLFTGTILRSQQNATVQGRLIELGSSEPVAKAAVELRDADAAASPATTTTSDRDGKFSFRNVPPGRYRVVTTRPGFIIGSSEILTIAPGQTPPAIQITMTRSGAISGHIYNKSGQPIANVAVSADRITFQGGTKGMRSTQGTLTNDLGEYRIFGVPPGLYYVTATQQLSPYPRFVYGGVQTVQTYARLRTETEPLAASSPTPVSVTWPDKTDPFAGSPVDVRPGSDVRNVNIIVGDMQHTTRLQGTFIAPETGQPVQLTSAALMSLAGLANRAMGAPQGGFITNPAFNLGFMPPGPYMMTADGPAMAGRYLFEIKDEDSMDISVKLQTGFNVSGKITVEGADAADVNLPGLQVELRLDVPINGLGITSVATAAADGSFNFQKVLPGTYLIGLPALQYQRPQPPRLVPALQNAYVKSIRLGSEEGIAGKLHIDAPPRDPVEIVIGTNAAALEGRVAGASGQVVNGVTVALIPDFRSRPETFKSTSTDTEGKFRFDHIPPGSYKVFAWELVENLAWRVPEFLAGDEPLGVPVQFAEGSRSTVDVPIIPAR